MAMVTPLIITSVFSKYCGGKRHFKNHPIYLKSKKMLIDMLIGNGRNILVNFLVSNDRFCQKTSLPVHLPEPQTCITSRYCLVEISNIVECKPEGRLLRRLVVFKIILSLALTP